MYCLFFKFLSHYQCNAAIYLKTFWNCKMPTFLSCCSCFNCKDTNSFSQCSFSANRWNNIVTGLFSLIWPLQKNIGKQCLQMSLYRKQWLCLMTRTVFECSSVTQMWDVCHYESCLRCLLWACGNVQYCWFEVNAQLNF